MAYVIVLNSQNTVNRRIVNTIYNIIFDNQRLDILLPPDVSKFRVEAYVRANNTSTGNSNARNISVRVNFRPTSRIVTQDMMGSTVVASTITQNIPTMGFQTNQFGQSKTVIDRPTGVNTIQVTFWDDNTNAQLTTSVGTGGANSWFWVMHLYFYPID